MTITLRAFINGLECPLEIMTDFFDAKKPALSARVARRDPLLAEFSLSAGPCRLLLRQELTWSLSAEMRPSLEALSFSSFAFSCFARRPAP